MKHVPMSIDTPNLCSLNALRRELGPVRARTVRTRRSHRLALAGDARVIAHALDAVQRWLLSERLATARVVVDGEPYEIQAGMWEPRAATQGWSRAA